MHLSSVTTTTHTRASAGTSGTATGSPREPSRNTVPVRNQIVFNTFWNVPSRTLPGPPRNPSATLQPCLEPAPEPSRTLMPRNLGTLLRTCPRTSLIGTPEPSQNLVPEPALEPVVRKPPRNRPGTYIPRNLQQDPLNGPLNLSI